MNDNISSLIIGSEAVDRLLFRYRLYGSSNPADKAFGSDEHAKYARDERIPFLL